MTDQLDLCAPPVVQRPAVMAHEMVPPRARRTDPDTSHEAAERVKEIAKSQRALVLRALKINPNPLTYRELSRDINRRWAEQAKSNGLYLDHVMVMRRLGDLKRDGVVKHGEKRSCCVQGTQMVTWVLVD